MTPHQHQATILRSLDIQTNTMIANIPRFDHIVSRSTYNTNMVKKQLLQHPSKGTLPDQISSLVVFQNATKMLTASLSGVGDCDAEEGPDAERDDPPEVCAAEQALDLANLAMTVLAGCAVVEEHSKTPQGRNMANQVISKLPPGFPESLKRKLMTIAASG